jgi:hypothetical protein
VSAAPEEADWAKGCLIMIYDCLDLDLTGYALQAEVSVSLLVFAAGHKSDKLAAVWELFGDSDDRVSPLILSLLLRGILLSFASMSLCVERTEGTHLLDYHDTSSSHHRSMQAAIGLIDRTVHCIVSAICPDDQPISYSGFADWYNKASSAVEPGTPAILWLELLDLAKWPRGSAASVLGSTLSLPEPDVV